MFQFPGFALVTLCIQVTSTWLTPLLITKGDNNEMSGGFPHSEIHGSKPIPGSPWHIAGYHVLHRLLLPRHSPNALIALDLIRKKQGFARSQKHALPVPALVHTGTLVSVYDLERLSSVPGHQPMARRIPTRIRPEDVSCILSLRCQFVLDRTVKSTARMRFTVKSQSNPWWSVAGSNR